MHSNILSPIYWWWNWAWRVSKISISLSYFLVLVKISHWYSVLLVFAILFASFHKWAMVYGFFLFLFCFLLLSLTAFRTLSVLVWIFFHSLLGALGQSFQSGNSCHSILFTSLVCFSQISFSHGPAGLWHLISLTAILEGFIGKEYMEINVLCSWALIFNGMLWAIFSIFLKLYQKLLVVQANAK